MQYGRVSPDDACAVPRNEYARRLAEREASCAQLDRRDRRIAYLRGAVFLATVVTEHTEDWCFAEDHVVPLPFVSVQEIRDGRICRWSDYSNIDTLLSAAPAWWLEHVTSAWTQD